MRGAAGRREQRPWLSQSLQTLTLYCSRRLERASIRLRHNWAKRNRYNSSFIMAGLMPEVATCCMHTGSRMLVYVGNVSSLQFEYFKNTFSSSLPFLRSIMFPVLLPLVSAHARCVCVHAHNLGACARACLCVWAKLGEGMEVKITRSRSPLSISSSFIFCFLFLFCFVLFLFCFWLWYSPTSYSLSSSTKTISNNVSRHTLWNAPPA